MNREFRGHHAIESDIAARAGAYELAARMQLAAPEVVDLSGEPKHVRDLYGIDDPPQDVMPMTNSWLGNSSVATLPTMLDLIRRGQLDDHKLERGQLIVLAAVGAGLTTNAAVTRMP